MMVMIIVSPIFKWGAVSPYLRPPYMLLPLYLAIGFLVAIGGRMKFSAKVPSTIWIGVFAVLESAMVSTIALGYQSSTLWLLAFMITYIAYFVFSLVALLEPHVFSAAARAFPIAHVVLALLILTDFVAANFFGIILSDHIGLSTGVPGVMSVYDRVLFKSVAGPADEPGDAAYYLNLLFWAAVVARQRLGGYRQRPRQSIHAIQVVLHCAALAATFSAAGILIFAASSFAYYLMQSPVRASVALPISAATAFAVFRLLPREIQEYSLRAITLKATLSTQDASAGDRLRAWSLGLDQLRDASALLFGHGLGYGSRRFELSWHSFGISCSHWRNPA